MINEKLVNIYSKKQSALIFTNQIGMTGFEFINPMLQEKVYEFLKNSSKFPDSIKNIILFGSSVTDRVTDKSDLDFLFVVDDSVDARGKDLIVTDLDRFLDPYFPYDLVIETMTDFKEGSKHVNDICNKAVTKGFEIWRKGGWLN